MYSGHDLQLGGYGGSGEKMGSGGKKIVLWPLGEESKVMGRPGVRGGSWRSSPESVAPEDEVATKMVIEGGMLEAEADAKAENEDEDNISQHSAVTGEADVRGHS